MPKARPSKEYTAFDKAMGRLLTVPKTVLDARMAEHRAKAALNPRKRGPKPKIKADASGEVDGDRAVPDAAVSAVRAL